jgi:hypothetical protein
VPGYLYCKNLTFGTGITFAIATRTALNHSLNLSLIIDGSTRTEFAQSKVETGNAFTVVVLPYGGFAGSIKL